MRALITGAGGFIGGALCHTLAVEGIEIVALRRPGSEALRGVLTVVADLASVDQVSACVEQVKPDLVFHLAAATHAVRDLAAVGVTFDVNLVSTVNLLTAVTRVGCRRIVLAGSLEEPLGDDSTAVPSSPYAASKWAASMYARMFWQLYQTPVAVARIFMVYGPGQRDERKLIPYAIRSLLAGVDFPLSSGLRNVDWVFVDDVARGLLALGLATGVDGLSLDVGTGQLTSVRSVVERLAAIVGGTGRPCFGALPDRRNEQIRRADVGSTEQLIGWRPLIGLEEGLVLTADSYRSIVHS